MKPSDDLKTLFPIYKGKDAQTINDLVKETGLGETAVRRHAQRMVNAGQWKEVKVRCKNAIASAYVRVR